MTVLLHDKDKHADALKAQRFRMLEDIALDLAGEIVFPTCVDVSIHLRDALRNPGMSAEAVAAAVGLDPLLSLKIVALANSAPYNPAEVPVMDLEQAIDRVDAEFARITALAMATDQLMRSRTLANFSKLSRKLWEHSLLSAVAAETIARTQTRQDPRQAWLAGLIHDLGAFYMLYRAVHYPELCSRPETLNYVIIQWHESIGTSLFTALALPERLIQAVEDHDHPRPGMDLAKARSLSDIVYISNLVAGGGFEWMRKDLDPSLVPVASGGTDPGLMGEIHSRYRALLMSIG